MRIASFLLAGFVALAGPAAAGNVLDDARAAGALVMQVCVPDSLDFEAAFTAAGDAAREAGLAAATEEDKLAIYGDPAGAHMVFTRWIDALSCAMHLPAATAAKEDYMALKSLVETGVKAVYPETLSTAGKGDTPHRESHDWVYDKAKDRHFAATLTWQEQDGILLAIRYRQEYD